MVSHSVAATPALQGHASSISSPTTQPTITMITRLRSSTSTSVAAERLWSITTWVWWTPLGLECCQSSSYRYTTEQVKLWGALYLVVGRGMFLGIGSAVKRWYYSNISSMKISTSPSFIGCLSTFPNPRVLCWWACGSCRPPWKHWQGMKTQKSRRRGTCWRKV